MNRSDFYLIKGSTFSDQINFCCRLVEKALTQNNRVHIHTAEMSHSEIVSNALWSFKPESFLPNVIGLSQRQIYPITIDCQALGSDDLNPTNLLVSLTTELPNQYQLVERLSLVILNQEQAIQRARAHYRQLKSEGVEVHYHDLR